MDDNQKKLVAEMLDMWKAITSLPHTPERAEEVRKLIVKRFVEIGISEEELPEEFKGGNISRWEDTDRNVPIETVDNLIENALSSSDQPPKIPFTVSELRDRLIRDEIPKEEWENVIRQLNSIGEAKIELDIAGRRAMTTYTVTRSDQIFITSKKFDFSSLASKKQEQPQKKEPIKLIFRYPDGGLPFSSPHFLVGDDHEAWVGSKLGGLCRLRLDDNFSITSITEEDGIISQKITCLHLTPRFVWAGCENGISFFDRNQNIWKSFKIEGLVSAILEFGDSLWIASDKLLMQLNLNSLELTGVELPRIGEVKSIVIADDEKVWCCYDEEGSALYYLDLQIPQWKQVNVSQYIRSLLYYPIIDGGADLWVGTYSGSYYLDRANLQSNYLDTGLVHSISHVDSFLLFGTEAGICGFDILECMIQSKFKIKWFNTKTRHVTALAGKKGILWYIAENEGVVCTTLETGKDIF